jgi:isopenicillin N synthase-like dioxygenase
LLPSEIAAEFAKNTIKLDQTVTEMVLEGLGVRDRHAIDSHREQLRYSFRMSYYSTSPEDDAARVSLTPHRDYVMTNVIQQHEVEGLEVQLSDGSWFAVPPELDTYIFVAGELFNVRPILCSTYARIHSSSSVCSNVLIVVSVAQFSPCMQVVTNGRVKACLHRVRTPSNRERYSALLGTMPAKGSTVRAIDELVDEDHPLVYNPCDPYEYCSYRYSEEGLRFRDALKAFCGVVKDEPLSA